MLQRLAIGTLAGISATMAMTAAMRHLFAELPIENRYPLPPRELTEEILQASDRNLPILAVLSHFGYGAAAGVIFTFLPRTGIFTGAIYGVSVWAASYLGWIPGLNVLKPATQHPAERNLLMMAAHLVWGAVLAVSTRELDQATRDVFADGKLRDSPPSSQRGLP